MYDRADAYLGRFHSQLGLPPLAVLPGLYLQLLPPVPEEMHEAKLALRSILTEERSWTAGRI
jgi:hypothetical protein